MTITTLGYALLGLLARESLTGYDLAAQLKARVGFFWHARHSQIYPELARLEAADLVTHAVVAQQERPDKKVYTITEAGRTALRRWVTAPVDVSLPRDELMLKAYSSWIAAPHELVMLLREHERQHRQQLAEYERIEAWLAQEFGPQFHEPGTPACATYITLRRGIGYEREYADWCNWTAALMEQQLNDIGT